MSFTLSQSDKQGLMRCAWNTLNSIRHGSADVMFFQHVAASFLFEYGKYEEQKFSDVLASPVYAVSHGACERQPGWISVVHKQSK